MKYIELFKNGFDSTITEKIDPENWPYVGYSPIDGFAFSITPNEDGTMYTIYRVVNKDISNCTYNMVDLGLPSGLKWADRNVGAASPEDYGSYFQWGDTNAYTFDGVGEVTAVKLAEILNPTLSPMLGEEITVDNVGVILEQLGITDTDLTTTPIGTLTFSLDKLFNWDSYFDTTDGGSTFNKYNNNGGLTVLESIDDAATVYMGSQYRMPTRDEILELINNTTLYFIDIYNNEYNKEQAKNGAVETGKLKGIKFIGLNNNSIFIPATGSCTNYFVDRVGENCELWSSGLHYNCSSAIGVNFTSDVEYTENNIIITNRYYGRSVRGVQT